MNKFFNNISYKHKVFCFSSLLLTTSIVCPLASCGSDNTINDIGGFDKEFGFDAQTYNNLEKQFTSKYGAYLWNITKDKDEYINKFNNFLQNDLTILRNKLFDPAKNYSFTVRTNTLLDYASKNFNIKLNRNANVSEVDFNKLKQSSLENFVIYMENKGFTEDEIDNRKKEFNNKFDEIKEDCKSKIDDNAQILIQLRADVIDCWHDLNDEFARMSAYNHLKKFFDEYEFKIKDQKDEHYSWDYLVRNSDFMGLENIKKIDKDINHSIEDDWIKKLFTISSKKTNKSEKKEDDKDAPTNDNSSAETISYSKEIIPGYILTPVLKTMSQDIYSNNYYMDIDWQLMSNSYENKDQETKDKVTAHLVAAKDGKAVDYTDFKDGGQLPSDNYQFTRYSLMATLEYQQEKMTEAYFDRAKESDQKITFSWNKDMIGIESFLKSDSIGADGEYNVPQDEYKVSMSRNNLSLIGLQLNGTNLSDLLNKKNNLQDKQSTNNANNDDNLKIEEKFVKYCDINANAIVSFSDNKISNNSIQNEFIVAFINSTSMKNNVEIKSTLNNIGLSNNFSNNAVNFYTKVVNYIDNEKILKEVESQHWLSNLILIELFILVTCIVIIWIEEIIDMFLLDVNDRPVYVNSDNIFWWECTFCFLYTAMILILYLVWSTTVNGPINNEYEKVKKWNEMITNRSKSDPNEKINVMDKAIVDKDNFKSANDFMKYYNTNPNSAFVSYYYYFHFVELSQKLTQEPANDKQSTSFAETVKKDYDAFNKTKVDNEINDRNFGRIVLAIIMSLFIIFSIIIIFYNLHIIKQHVHDRNELINRQNHNPPVIPDDPPPLDPPMGELDEIIDDANNIAGDVNQLANNVQRGIFLDNVDDGNLFNINQNNLLPFDND